MLGKPPEPYSPTSAPPSSQPKVHNLNISIHNNANYAAPFPIENAPFQAPTPAYQTPKIPMKTVLSPKGGQTKQPPKAQPKPQSASYNLASQIVCDISKTLRPQTGPAKRQFKKPSNFENLQLEDGRAHTPAAPVQSAKGGKAQKKGLNSPHLA